MANIILFFGAGVPWPVTLLVGLVTWALALRSGPLSRGVARTLARLYFAFIQLGLPLVWGHSWSPFLVLLALNVALAWGLWRWIRQTYIKDDALKVELGKSAPFKNPVVLSGADRFLHLHVLGPTGSGKTQGVLWPLISQDLARDVGVSVLDPKGDLAERTFVRAKALGREAYFIGPKESSRLDALAGTPRQAAEHLAYALSRVYPSEVSFFQTLSHTLLVHAVLVLKESPGPCTLQRLLAFLTDEDERRQVLLSSKSEEGRAFFKTQYATWSARARGEYTLGLTTALSDLLAHEQVRSILSPPADVDLDEVLRRGAVVAVSVPLSEFGTAGRVLGAFFLMRFQAAALSRAPGRPHFLYVDEFQQFAAEGFGEFLELARSYEVGATLAHQSLSQLTPALRAAVLTNARNRVLLGGVSSADLKVMEESLGSRMGLRETLGPDGTLRSRTLVKEAKFAPEQVRTLPRGRALVQLVLGGKVDEPRLVQLPKPDMG